MPEFTAEAGRLDTVVAKALGVTRADVQRAIAAGGVLVDGVARPKSFRLGGGERVSAELSVATALKPDPGGVPVLFEDDHLVVVDKPAGLPVHPTASRRSGTLVNRLLGAGIPLAPAGRPLRPGIVHRLDAGTSGALVVAKDDETFRALQATMRRHEAEREYAALLRGVPEHERFVVEAPLARQRANIVVRPATGRAAETEFAVEERFPRAALVAARPRTGRTHQIRVHAAAIGHPVLGDVRYGGGGSDARALGLARPFLHARRLAFVHPATKERVVCQSPLPPDLEEALRRVRTATGSLPAP